MNAFSAGKHSQHGAFNMVHDVITTAYPLPYTAKFMFVSVRNNKTQQIRR